jgi:hypothetical protein
MYLSSSENHSIWDRTHFPCLIGNANARTQLEYFLSMRSSHIHGVYTHVYVKQGRHTNLLVLLHEHRAHIAVRPLHHSHYYKQTPTQAKCWICPYADSEAGP